MVSVSTSLGEWIYSSLFGPGTRGVERGAPRLRQVTRLVERLSHCFLSLAALAPEDQSSEAFQLARNLSALARAQQEAAQALLHIDTLSDCINREIIMSAASSQATEQLVASAKATCFRFRTFWRHSLMKGANRLRDADLLHYYATGALIKFIGVP